MLMMMMMVMMNQGICWFNYRTWWRRGIYPSTMGHIMGMRINHQWWGFSFFVLWLTYGVYLKKTTSGFPHDEKNDEKNQWNIIVSKKKGIMMRKASAFFGATFQIPIKIASKYAIWQKWRFCRTANEKNNAWLIFGSYFQVSPGFHFRYLFWDCFWDMKQRYFSRIYRPPAFFWDVGRLLYAKIASFRVYVSCGVEI